MQCEKIVGGALALILIAEGCTPARRDLVERVREYVYNPPASNESVEQVQKPKPAHAASPKGTRQPAEKESEETEEPSLNDIVIQNALRRFGNRLSPEIQEDIKYWHPPSFTRLGVLHSPGDPPPEMELFYYLPEEDLERILIYVSREAGKDILKATDPVQAILDYFREIKKVVSIGRPPDEEPMPGDPRIFYPSASMNFVLKNSRIVAEASGQLKWDFREDGVFKIRADIDSREKFEGLAEFRRGPWTLYGKRETWLDGRRRYETTMAAYYEIPLGGVNKNHKHRKRER